MNLSIYEIMYGDPIKSDKNNILKSLTIYKVENSRVLIEAEPYDDAYDTENIYETMDKVKRIFNRREKSFFKYLNEYFGIEIKSIVITFFDSMSTCGGMTKIKGKDAELVY